MGSENQMEMMERGGGGNEAEVWAVVQAQVKRHVDLVVVVGGGYELMMGVKVKWIWRRKVGTEVEAMRMYLDSGEGKRSREIIWSVGYHKRGGLKKSKSKEV